MAVRRAILVTGLVQGVGFRPFVHRLASRLGLGGCVKNQNGSVLIEVEGDTVILNYFLAELADRPPPLAQIRDVSWRDAAPRNESAFRIEDSAHDGQGWIDVGWDVATCPECLQELLDPADRRYRYPFLNCTNCGPRLTIIREVPYDRARTTMAGFAMCAACRAEYDDPANRRFHAQPTACPACGPRLAVWGADGRSLSTADALAHAVTALRAGKIIAVKGLGGYHLACDASNEQAVAELRRRKLRDEKPFAIMVADVPAVERLCELSPAERELLLCPRRPIVLLRKRLTANGSNLVAESVAPGNPLLGVTLPYTPLHHLLLHDLNGLPLVMTSGNRCDEPIAFDDADAAARLAGIADFFLTHDRPIQLRCDDSVSRVVAGEELPLRRSRGHAPQPIALPFACPFPILATGGQLKATFALGQQRQAVLSHHLGDLDDYLAFRAYVDGIERFERLFATQPEWIVHDLHPDYASTAYALQRVATSGMTGLRLLAVPHHHAHVASCMAENGLDEPVIGVAFDGAGLGIDGTIWGGEFLVGDYRSVRRAAHLRPVAMPGGAQAIREPWRMAVAHLVDAAEDRGLLQYCVSAAALRMVQGMIERRFNAPLTSSAGRLFDAMAALAGVRQRVSYEGQAAMELEWLAAGESPVGHYPFELSETDQGQSQTTLVIDTRPLIAATSRDVRQGTAPARIGRRFHSTLVEIIAQVCARLRAQTGLSAVALSGGVFMNALLLTEAIERLTADGFQVYRHRRVPPNDGGLCLGQLAIAAATRAAART